MVKQKMISVDYYFRLHQIPKNSKIIFQKTFYAETNEALIRKKNSILPFISWLCERENGVWIRHHLQLTRVFFWNKWKGWW